jgi:hypothetical protein
VTDRRDLQPSFVTALVAVLAGGTLGAFASGLFVGFSIYLGGPIWQFVTGMLGAYMVRMILSLMGYELSLFVAAVAMLLGVVLSRVFMNVFASGIGALPGISLGPMFPTFASLWTIPILLLSAWIVQQAAHRERHVA